MLCLPHGDSPKDGSTSRLSPRVLARNLFKRHNNNVGEEKVQAKVESNRKISTVNPPTRQLSTAQSNGCVVFPPPGYRPTVLNTLLVGETSNGVVKPSANALDLTAAATDALLKNRRNPWVQLSGHPDSFSPAGPHTVWKRRVGDDSTELEAYKKLSTDTAHSLAPHFYREVPYNGEYFIELEDLLQHFHSPYVMDIKMGTRTFLESEVSNEKLRPDLYEKLVKLAPDEPTAEEREAGAITKLRYMQFRENESSSANLGFRIDAMKTEGDPEALKKMKTFQEVSHCIKQFLHNDESVRKKMLSRLKEIKQKLEKSDFFKHHEIVGSSLLFLFDSKGHAGVWMIDFAKSMPVEGRKLSHREKWVKGNHEDGYLIGLDNLIAIFSSISHKSTS